MSIFTINADFHDLVVVLREIRDILYRMNPEPRPIVQGKPAGPEALFEFDPEKEFLREQEEEARNIGTSPTRE
jgi:hypothetical protein